MAANQDSDGPQMMTNSEFFDNHRHAHRVFRAQGGKLILNPFRHIPWTAHRELNQQTLLRRQTWQEEEIPVFKRGIFKFKFLVPEEPFTVANQLKRTFLTSWINVILVCVPVGLTLNVVRGSSAETFAVNYIAEIPLWFLCDYALEEMEKYIGRTASDIVDIFTNNTVQIISSVLLLKAHQVDILQTSLIGGILSNILVLLGLSLVFGGMSNHEQHFNRICAQGSSSLLSIASTSLLIPTAVKQLKQTTKHSLVLQSRGVAFVLLFVFITYSFCQMVTHKKDYADSGKRRQQAKSGHPRGSILQVPSSSDSRRTSNHDAVELATVHSGAHVEVAATEHVSRRDGGSSMIVESIPKTPEPMQKSDDEILGPQLHFWVAAALFVVTIALLYFCISATVDSIAALTDQTSLSQTFVGLILLPIPNCDFAPVSMAVDDYVEQTMKYTVGRSIQTALLVEPMVVLLAWWIGVGGVTLAFDGFEVVSLFTTILLLNFLVVDAKVHWVHGVLLLADWVLIGIAAYFVTPEVLS